MPNGPGDPIQSQHQVNDADGIARISLRRLIACRTEARRLGIAAPGRVLATRAGSHLSPFRGAGIDYDESRVYVSGDDPRSMDWRVTARTGRAHVKVFREERERPVWLLVDQRAGMRFGTRVAFKSVIAARAAALLGWAAVERGERVGGLVFDERGHRKRRPEPRQSALLALLGALSATQAAGAGRTCNGLGCAQLGEAVQQLLRLAPDGGTLFVLSDFAGADGDPGWLDRLTQRCEVALVAVHDPIEETAPPPGRWPLWVAGRRLVLDTGSAGQRAWYEQGFRRRRRRLADMAVRRGAHLLTLRTDWPVGASLARGLGQPAPGAE